MSNDPHNKVFSVWQKMLLAMLLMTIAIAGVVFFLAQRYVREMKRDVVPMFQTNKYQDDINR